MNDALPVNGADDLGHAHGEIEKRRDRERPALQAVLEIGRARVFENEREPAVEGLRARALSPRRRRRGGAILRTRGARVPRFADRVGPDLTILTATETPSALSPRTTTNLTPRDSRRGRFDVR